MTRLPSIRSRLARALAGWSLVWGLAVVAAVWLAVRHEVDELLDDALQASAEVLAALLTDRDGAPASDARGAPPVAVPSHADTRFAWQVIGPGAQVLAHSRLAPAAPLQATPTAGFSHTDDWRVYGMPLGSAGRMLYVAQSQEERSEAEAEVALNTALAALAIGVLGHLWLRLRVAHELVPLQRLSTRLASHDPLESGATLGPAEREELQPVQAAIDALGQRLARRLSHERAFTAHAAHSLRTPLAGIDAQLAVALRESPPSLAPRLRRVRDAAGRLERVVAALLALFRSDTELQRQAIDLPSLLQRLPVEGLRLDVQAAGTLQADPDLLVAALLNLLDNSLRSGAQHVVVSSPQPGTVRLHDDGPGVSPPRRAALQTALDNQAYDGQTGLGLMLADLVARSHGGRLLLPPAGRGFAVDLVLAPPG